MFDRAGDPDGARVRPLAWGMTVTMQFDYFYAFVALALALPVAFARRREPA